MCKMELHVHSTFSDGEQTPEEVLHIAKEQGVKVLAFTDHDEMSAYHHSLELAKSLDITLIPGIELNTDGVDSELHILGYFFDPDHPKMAQHIAWRKQERSEWAQKIINKLNVLGYDVTMMDVMMHAEGDIIVRTHIAKALHERGYFSTPENAYQSLLVKGKPAFQKRQPFSAEDAIQLIQQCDGEAHLAHPGAYTFEVNEENILSYGVDGIEVYHSKHTSKDITYWQAFSEKNKLFVSGGSDCHGPLSRNAFQIGSIQPGNIERWLEKAGVKK